MKAKTNAIVWYSKDNIRIETFRIYIKLQRLQGSYLKAKEVTRGIETFFLDVETLENSFTCNPFCGFDM